MEDPAKQEAIRRGPHEYVPGDGKHGFYRPTAPSTKEYPKMMGRAPRPLLANFLKVNGVEIPLAVAQAQLEQAVKEWDQYLCTTIVHSKVEEAQWLREHKE